MILIANEFIKSVVGQKSSIIGWVIFIKYGTFVRNLRFNTVSFVSSFLHCVAIFP